MFLTVPHVPTHADRYSYRDHSPHPIYWLRLDSRSEGREGTVRHREHATHRGDDGFSLVELTAVVLIIGILAIIALVVYTRTSASAEAAACYENQRAFISAVALYQAQNDGAYPSTIEDLRPYIGRTWERISVCPSDGAPLTYDPALHQVVCPNHAPRF